MYVKRQKKNSVTSGSSLTLLLRIVQSAATLVLGSHRGVLAAHSLLPTLANFVLPEQLALLLLRCQPRVSTARRFVVLVVLANVVVILGVSCRSLAELSDTAAQLESFQVGATQRHKFPHA